MRNENAEKKGTEEFEMESHQEAGRSMEVQIIRYDIWKTKADEWSTFRKVKGKHPWQKSSQGGYSGSSHEKRNCGDHSAVEKQEPRREEKLTALLLDSGSDIAVPSVFRVSCSSQGPLFPSKLAIS